MTAAVGCAICGSYCCDVSGMHFERMADDYSTSRPSYPGVVFEALKALEVIGPGLRVLEVGAGSGLATRDLVKAGSNVTALEPGPKLVNRLRRNVPGASIIIERLEDSRLPGQYFDAAVAATTLHWVDLSIGLPKLHAALRPKGWLASWRNIFGDDSVTTDFRERINCIVADRVRRTGKAHRPPSRPTMEELASGGWFEPIDTERWRWSTDLTTEQVRRLLRTFSDWDDAEVEAAARAADECGGLVTEHYQSVLHLLVRR